MSNKHLWECIDPDNLQYCLTHMTDNLFTFREFDRNTHSELFESVEEKDIDQYWDDPSYWISDTIDLEDYSEDEIIAYCSGYYSEETIKDWLDKEIFSEIIADCIFEQTNNLL